MCAIFKCKKYFSIKRFNNQIHFQIVHTPTNYIIRESTVHLHTYFAKFAQLNEHYVLRKGGSYAGISG